MIKIDKTINFNKKLKQISDPELKHDIKKGKARQCIKCTKSYQCCKVCDLCKTCHWNKFGVTTVSQDHQKREEEYFQKENARRNPGYERSYGNGYYNIDDDY